MEKKSIIRTIYLYLFTIVGLTLLTIGGVHFIDMGLKAFIFTKADSGRMIEIERPMIAPYSVSELEEIKDGKEISEEQKVLIEKWLVNYENWEKESTKVNYIVSNRQRDASINLSLILVGLPLYLYHWSIIKRETKKS